MTTKQLSFKTVPEFPIIEGATSPDLGANAKGAWAWSSSIDKPVYWTGTNWTTGNSAPSTPLTVKSATVNFPIAKFSQATATVVEATVTIASKINAWLAPNTEWDADDLVGYSVSAKPKAGSIEFCVYSNAPIVGNFNIYYFWS
jgi:hypothetical protein